MRITLSLKSFSVFVFMELRIGSSKKLLLEMGEGSDG